MKLAIAYNSQQGQLFCRRGSPTHEWIKPQHVQRMVETLRGMGHDAVSLDADVNVVDRLREFFNPGAGAGQTWPGLVLNLAYGLQGELRYVHLPAVLEMLGIPYIGSDPLGQALASDKLTAKRLFRAAELPTPNAAPHGAPRAPHESGKPPAVVKPLADAASAGIQLAHDRQDLRQIFAQDDPADAGPVLVEEFVDGREINVALIGNDPVTTLPPVEVVIRGEGPSIYDADTKKGHGDRSFELLCPAPLDAATSQRACELAIDAFEMLRCRDWGRVDLRLDDEGNLTLLEMNTIPGIADSSSYRAAAREAGMPELSDVLARLIDVAIERYAVPAAR